MELQQQAVILWLRIATSTTRYSHPLQKSRISSDDLSLEILLGCSRLQPSYFSWFQVLDSSTQDSLAESRPSRSFGCLACRSVLCLSSGSSGVTPWLSHIRGAVISETFPTLAFEMCLGNPVWGAQRFRTCSSLFTRECSLPSRLSPNSSKSLKMETANRNTVQR